MGKRLRLNGLINSERKQSTTLDETENMFLSATVYKGQCGPGKCGQEAACQPFPNNSFTCICPHDSSPPTSDLKCPNRATVPLTPRPIHNIILPSEINESNKTQLQQQQHTPFVTKTLFTGVAKNSLFILVFISISICFMIFYCLRQRCTNKKMQKMTLQASLQKMGSLHSLQKSSMVPVTCKENPNYTMYSSSVPLIYRNKLKFLHEIGQGCFGKVYKGEYINEETDSIEDVAIKVLKETASRETEEDFMREVEIMSTFKHNNILSLLGVVVRESDSLCPMMVFEFMAHGDLAEVLRDKKYLEYLNDETFLSFGSQIAAGMQYLAMEHFVHRDLACRNCLVTEQFVVKIADFGMSRDVYTSDYYKMGGSRLLPVRWMSPESITYGRFTFESDIWSYGIVLWEIYSRGKQPYYGYTNDQVIKMVLNGTRLESPDNCPEFVYNLMQNCWKVEAKDRVKFPQICQYLLSWNNIIYANAQIKDYANSYLPRPPSFTVNIIVDESSSNPKTDQQGYLLPKNLNESLDYFQPI